MGFYSISTGDKKKPPKIPKNRLANIERGTFIVAEALQVPAMRGLRWWDTRTVHVLSTGGSVRPDRIVRRDALTGEPTRSGFPPRRQRLPGRTMGSGDVHDQLRLQRNARGGDSSTYWSTCKLQTSSKKPMASCGLASTSCTSAGVAHLDRAHAEVLAGGAELLRGRGLVVAGHLLRVGQRRRLTVARQLAAALQHVLGAVASQRGLARRLRGRRRHDDGAHGLAVVLDVAVLDDVVREARVVGPVVVDGVDDGAAADLRRATRRVVHVVVDEGHLRLRAQEEEGPVVVAVARGRVLRPAVELAVAYGHALDTGCAGGDHLAAEVGDLDVVDPDTLHGRLAAVEALDVDGVAAPDEVRVQLSDVDVLDDDVVAVEPQSLALDHSARTETAEGLVARDHERVLAARQIVRDLDLGAVHAATRVGHAAALQDDVLALVAVVLGEAVAVALGATTGLGLRAFRAAEVKGLGKDDDTRLRVLEVVPQVVERGRVHGGDVAAAGGARSEARCRAGGDGTLGRRALLRGRLFDRVIARTGL
ncbi:hypothetical protein ON010_g12929 [Phytophthora cinnamomi]|nr:hypothetical protein ON010_g12929 [Phytophthora cinnamomi]